MSTINAPDETFKAVLNAAQLIIAARGVDAQDTARKEYTESGITIARTEVNEIEITVNGRVVFRVPLDDSHGRPICLPGEWIEEVNRINQSVAHGRSGRPWRDVGGEG